MVEINNQRKAFLDMLAWSEELITRTSENQKSWLWRHCRRRAIYWLLRSPSQTCHAKPKLKSAGAGRYQLLSRWWDAYRKPSLAWKTSLRKVRTLWHCSRLRSVALYLWLIVVISVRQSTVAAISGFTAGRGLWSVQYGRFPADCKIQRSGRNGQRLMYEQSHRDYLRSGYLHHDIPVTFPSIHAICVPQSPARQKCRTDWRTLQLLTCRCVSVMLLRSMQNTRRS